MSTAQATTVGNSGEAARAVAPGSFRHTVLSAAKRFKSTWVELGKLLVRVRDEGLFQQWGYESFETYCFKELRIKKQTAYKLTRSWSFLNKHEPKLATSLTSSSSNADEVGDKAPSFEVIEVLAGAEDRGQLNASEYKSIRDSIWSGEKPESELRRELVDRFPRPVQEPSEAAVLRRLAGLARKLANELAATRQVPRTVAERAAALADDVDELASKKG